MLQVSINLNASVWVKLTEQGKKVFREYSSEHQFAVPSLDGFLKFVLWDLMNVFGKHMLISSPPCFEKALIYLTDPTL